MKLLAFAILALGLFGCTHNDPSPAPSPIAGIACSLETDITAAMAVAVSSAATCSNGGQIQADIQAALGKANFCQQSMQAKLSAKLKGKVGGPIGNLICPIAVQTALGVVGSKLPAAWGCSPTSSTNALSGLLTSACSSVVPL